jgi:hypothetical protein
MWTVVYYMGLKDIVYDRLSVCVIRRLRIIVGERSGLEWNTGEIRGISSMKAYITNEKASRWILNGCYTSLKVLPKWEPTLMKLQPPLIHVPSNTDSKAQKIKENLWEFTFVFRHISLSNCLISPLNNTPHKVNLVLMLGSDPCIIFLHHSMY